MSAEPRIFGLTETELGEALKRIGVDMDCGACAEAFITGDSIHAHTCGVVSNLVVEETTEVFYHAIDAEDEASAAQLCAHCGRTPCTVVVHSAPRGQEVYCNPECLRAQYEAYGESAPEPWRPTPAQAKMLDSFAGGGRLTEQQADRFIELAGGHQVK